MTDPYHNPVGAAMARGDTPTLADVVARCADLESAISAAVVLLARISQRSIDRCAAGEHPALLIDAAQLAALERTVDQIRGRAGYVAELRARHARRG